MKNKLLRVIKMSILYSVFGLLLQVFFVNLVFAITPLSAQSFDEILLSFSLENSTLEKTLDVIESQSGYKFFYIKEDLPLDEPTSISAINESIVSVLEKLASFHSLTFKRINNQIVIKKAPKIVKESRKTKIFGIIIDSKTGEPLVGANIVLVGTGYGAAANIDGYFLILNVPPNEYQLKASYIGYKDTIITVRTISNRKLELNIELTYSGSSELTDVVVTGQAQGQMNAINKQLSSKTITNIVSAKQIQEIPDVNAAEAIGRLPGVSILRSGGEGNKVVIRGLSPKYNQVKVEGVKMAATGSDDRSSDLSMISPYMLEGIEVSKAALPDKEADVIGGSVNFILREAPEVLQFDVLAQGSYNGLKSEFGGFKFVAGGSNRFFDKKLGVFAQVDVENRNRDSYELEVNYTNYTSPLDPEEVDVSIGNLLYKDISRKIQRYGGTVVLDYKLNDGKIKFSNFISGINNDNQVRYETLRPFYVDHFYTIEDNENSLFVMTNALSFEKSFSSFKIDGRISYALSQNESPRSLTFQGYEPDAFDKEKLNYEVNPEILPSFANNNINNAYLYDVAISSYSTEESEVSFDINLEYNFSFSKQISLLIKTGFMYKHLEKKYDKEVNWMPIHWGGGEPASAINLILETYPWMQDSAPLGSVRLPYSLFIDPTYNPENFLGGNYTIQNIPDLSLANEIGDLLEPTFFHSYPRSIKDDYSGYEDYNAGFLMTDIKIGSFITFIPGFRYEKNRTIYTGVRGNEQTKLEYIGYAHYDTTTTRENEFFLPMIHLKYKPVEWFDVRLAYTQTISRPNYNQIIPSWNRRLKDVAWNNPYLKPARSTNIDLYASIFSNEIGLFSVGGFYKKIEDLIFSPGASAIVDPDVYGLPETSAGKTIYRMINNKYPVYVKGIEIEWQTHFWYLPGLLKGIVFNINYTHTESEVKYPRTIVETEYLNESPWVQITNIDTFFTDRLINQPNNILNVTIGYDYKGFSTRISMLYQDDIFRQDNFWRKLRSTSDELIRWDISIRQKLPIKGLEVLGNFNNVTASIERDINIGTNYPRREQHYGFMADIGIRYRF
jgi:TonB-dependent receptor